MRTRPIVRDIPRVWVIAQRPHQHADAEAQRPLLQCPGFGQVWQPEKRDDRQLPDWQIVVDLV